MILEIHKQNKKIYNKKEQKILDIYWMTIAIQRTQLKLERQSDPRF